MGMMKAKIELRGRVGNDPVFTEAKSGKKFCRLSIAVNTGPQENRKTSWFPVLFNDKWNLDGWQKGDLVDIEGDIRADSYEKDGEKRYSFTVFPTSVFNISLAERNREKNKAELAKGEEFDTNFEEPADEFQDLTIQ